MYVSKNGSGRRMLAWALAALLALALGQVLGILWTALQERGTAPETPEPEPAAFYVTGTVIRREQVIYAPAAADWQPCLLSGQRAAKGQTLFLSGQTTAFCLATGSLGAAKKALTLAETPLPQRKQQLQTAVLDYSGSSVSSDTALRALMLSWGGQGETALAAAQEELAAAPMGPAAAIAAPESGLYYAAVDGLEEVLTPEHPYTDAADLPAKEVSALALGRLITSDTWYFSADLPFSVETGDRLEAELLGGGFGRCTFTVEEAAPSETGCHVLLSSSQALESVAGVRRLTVKMSEK